MQRGYTYNCIMDIYSLALMLFQECKFWAKREERALANSEEVDKLIIDYNMFQNCILQAVEMYSSVDKFNSHNCCCL